MRKQRSQPESCSTKKARHSLDENLKPTVSGPNPSASEPSSDCSTPIPDVEPLNTTGYSTPVSKSNSAPVVFSRLPKFSTRIQQQLEKADITADLDKLVEECAYHIISCGDMKDRGLYDEFGRLMWTHYPCIEHPGTHPWVSLLTYYLPAVACCLHSYIMLVVTVGALSIFGRV